MKTKYPLLFAGLSLLFVISKGNAQASVASNTVTSTNYLGSDASSNVDVLFKRNNVFAGILATTSTSLGVNSFAPAGSISIGTNAGKNSTGHNSVFVGNTTGFYTSGDDNVFIGNSSGLSTNTGHSNTFIGGDSGVNNATGYSNVYAGYGAGGDMENGNWNTCIGTASGSFSDGASHNVFIGAYAGYGETGSNKLCINNNYTRVNSLIWGDFAESQLKFHGKVGIGGNSSTAFGTIPTTTIGSIDISNYSLFVKGGILTEEVLVRLKSTWPDYVFLKDYKLPTLDEVETHIKEKGHLRNVPSAKEVKENGIELGEMSKIQQEKIEELTLYLIQQNKEIQAQNKEISELKTMLKALLEKNN